MDIKKFKVILFATVKKLQGYTLLRNHGVCSPYEVNMIKNTYGIDSIWGDRKEVYTRIKRDFSDDNDKMQKQVVTTVRYLIDRKYTANKSINYKCSYKGGSDLYFNRSIDKTKLAKRVDPELDIFAVADLNHRLKQKKQELAYFVNERHNDYINGPVRPSFWMVLRENTR